MSNPSKAKGTRWETAIVDFLTARGITARRQPLYGGADRGDVVLPDHGIVVEAKNKKAYQFGEAVDQANAEAANAGMPYGVAVVKRNGKGLTCDGFVVMDVETFTELIERLP